MLDFSIDRPLDASMQAFDCSQKRKPFLDRMRLSVHIPPNDTFCKSSR